MSETIIVEVCGRCYKRSATRNGVFCDKCRSELKAQGIKVKE